MRGTAVISTALLLPARGSFVQTAAWLSFLTRTMSLVSSISWPRSFAVMFCRVKYHLLYWSDLNCFDNAGSL
jgi:hypothetical protein